MQISIPIGRALNQQVPLGPLPVSGDGEPEIREDGLWFDPRPHPSKAELVRTVAQSVDAFIGQYSITGEWRGAMLAWQKIGHAAGACFDALPQVVHQATKNSGSIEFAPMCGHEHELHDILMVLGGWDWNRIGNGVDAKKATRQRRTALEKLRHVVDRLRSLAPKFEDPNARPRQEVIDLTERVKPGPQETQWITLTVAEQRYHVTARALRYAIDREELRSRQLGPHRNSKVEVDEIQVKARYPRRK